MWTPDALSALRALGAGELGVEGLAAAVRGSAAGDALAVALTGGALAPWALPEVLGSLARMARPPRVERGLVRFDAHLTEDLTGPGDLAALLASPWLLLKRRLTLGFGELTDDDVLAIGACPWLANITELNLSDTHVSPAGLSALLGVGRLSWVILNGGLSVDNVEFAWPRFDVAHVAALVASPAAAGITDLRLENNELRDDDVAPLLGSALPAAASISIVRHNRLSAGMVETFRARFAWVA